MLTESVHIPPDPVLTVGTPYPAELGQCWREMSSHSYLGGPRATVAITSIGEIPLSAQKVAVWTEGTSGSQVRHPPPLWHLGGLLGAWTGLCHPPEGPWVVCTDSKKKTFPTLPDYTMAERKTLAALHPPRTHADTQRLAMVPEFIEGGLRRKSCGAQTLFFPKRP